MNNTIRTWGNPYTHEEHSRECHPNNPKTHWVMSCDWCGQKPRRLYRYDGDRHWFCNRDCYNSYHN